VKFSEESKIQSEKQKVARDSFEKIKVWEAKNNNVPNYCSRMNGEDKTQVQASLDSWCTNCEFSQDLIKETNKNCSNIWDLDLDIIEIMRCTMFNLVREYLYQIFL